MPDFSLIWEWGRAKTFKVVSGSTQAPPTQYVFTPDLSRTLLSHYHSVSVAHVHFTYCASETATHVYILAKSKSVQKTHQNTRIAGNFRGRKPLRISRIFDHQRKFSLRNLGHGIRTLRVWHTSRVH